MTDPVPGPKQPPRLHGDGCICGDYARHNCPVKDRKPTDQLPSKDQLPFQIPKRRKRSDLSRQDCLRVLEEFAKKVHRFGESSGAGMFREGTDPNLPPDQINVQFAVFGSFGTAAELFEAIRVLAGYKLPRVKR